MQIQNINRHLSCSNYENGNRPSVESVTLKKGQEIKKDILECEMVFVRKGYFYISYQKINRQVVSCGEVILLPPACNFTIEAREDTHIVLFRINTSMSLCHSFAIERLFTKEYKPKDEVCFLKINERIDAFLDLFCDCLGDGLKCSHYFGLKVQELLYYLRLYYPKDKLADFFSPILTNNSSFANFVFQNYKKVKTVQQFSSLYGYSQSSFEKQFKKVFGVSAYQWMIDQKSKQIYHRLTCSDKGLAEIADEFDFSSPSQFCDFCKRFLGDSPGKIRRATKCAV